MTNIGLRKTSTDDAEGDYFTIGNFQVVDLTQYFNGDSALIDSITSWDDLVAYDPRFSQYVEYNTGTVTGVVPAVSVNNGTAIASPNELFAVGSAADEFEAVSGTTTRKMGSLDLSTWTFSWYSQYSRWYSINNQLTDLAHPDENSVNAISDNYVVRSNATGVTVGSNILVIGTNGRILLYSDENHPPTGMLYYELAEPATSTSTPTQISLQAGNNTAMQTDGGRLAPIDITYESDEL